MFTILCIGALCVFIGGIYGIYVTMSDRAINLFAGMILIGGIAGLALVLAAVSVGSGSGSGISVGVVTNVAQQGTFWQPWEVWIVHQGEMKAEAFGVDQKNAALIEELKRDADEARRVRVFYESSRVCWAWHQSNCNVITKVVEEPSR